MEKVEFFAPEAKEFDRLNLLMKGLYTHIKYKTSEIVKRVPNVGYSKATIYQYANAMRIYCEKGLEDVENKCPQWQNTMKTIKKYVDKFRKQHISMLTPSEKKGEAYVGGRNKIVKLVQPTIKQVETEQTREIVQENYIVVVCEEEIIETFENADMAIGFKKGIETISRYKCRVFKGTKIEEL